MFNQLIGQSNAVNILSHSIMNDKVSQAYIFYGPPGTGKIFAAFEFAKALNCHNLKRIDLMKNVPDEYVNFSLPCNECISCKKISTYNHPDIKYIFPIPNYDLDENGVVKSNQEFNEVKDYLNNRINSPWKEFHFEKATAIRIEQIRALQREISLSSYEGNKKVYIFENFDTLTTSASNAFLKTLEEPPKDTHFILTVDSLNNLLPTIISRCQKIEFHHISTELIEKYLVDKLYIEPINARLYSRLSNGNFEKAINMSQNDDTQTMDMTIAFLQIVISNDDHEFLQWLDKHFGKNTKNQDLLKSFVEYLNLWISDLQMFNLCQHKLIFINHINLISHFYVKNPLLLEILPELQLKLDDFLKKLNGNVNQKLILVQVYHTFLNYFTL